MASGGAREVTAVEEEDGGCDMNTKNESTKMG